MNDRFDFQPVLEGERVRIRPLREADRAALFEAARDPLIWAQHPARDRCTQAGFQPYFDSAVASGSAFVFEDRESGQLIGSSRYHGFDPLQREVEIGWTFLSRACWGGSWNAEIKRLMLAHAFRFVDTVVFWVGADNHRSRRAMEKIGGVLRPGMHRRAVSGDAENVVFEIRKA